MPVYNEMSPLGIITTSLISEPGSTECKDLGGSLERRNSKYYLEWKRRNDSDGMIRR
jgi:hypothetical protein